MIQNDKIDKKHFKNKIMPESQKIRINETPDHPYFRIYEALSQLHSTSTQSMIINIHY